MFTTENKSKSPEIASQFLWILVYFLGVAFASSIHPYLESETNVFPASPHYHFVFFTYL